MQFLRLRANVWKYQATDGHGQNLVFAKIWFVDGFYRLNKCDVVCFSKYRLNFEKKVENLFRLMTASITYKIVAKLVAPKMSTACEQGIKLLKLSCNVLIKETFCKYFAAKLSPDNDLGWNHSKLKIHLVLSAVQNGILLWKRYEDFNNVAHACSVYNSTCMDTTCYSKTCVKFVLGNCIYASYGRGKVE